ncbi:Long-chain-fatty-acid--CoA ligase [Geobacillus stearothermophilus]|uniref:Long-chain-fatty-acid--CoA ligase n=1 Tax=Geobacillus stearothermophilus TaxID=1422 RepID=A0A150NDA7_GEOSE|nr:hypothetical protein AP057_00105 [Geobacillus sp. Sah69]KYD34674.1 Long-chain-fatty-acid--CoA ligase [Geobacillus stearothermophilus]OAO79914.1 Long-chain-fatty-acid--CoA ligase [Geobacillus stearothermophilus]
MNLTTRLAQIAKQLPDKEAYVFMGERCTYQQLDAAVSRFADGLAQLGIRRGGSHRLIAWQFAVICHRPVRGAAARSDRHPDQSDLYAGRNWVYFA